MRPTYSSRVKIEGSDITSVRKKKRKYVVEEKEEEYSLVDDDGLVVVSVGDILYCLLSLLSDGDLQVVTVRVHTPAFTLLSPVDVT